MTDENEMKFEEYNQSYGRIFRTMSHINRRLSAAEWLIGHAERKDAMFVKYLVEDTLDMIDFSIQELNLMESLKLDRLTQQRLNKIRSIYHDMGRDNFDAIGHIISLE